MSDPQKESLLKHWKCMAACTLVSMCPFQYGLDFGIIGGLQAMPGFLQIFGEKDPTSPIGYNISPGRQQLISSLMILGAFLSSSMAGPLAKFIGRKMSIWLACVICIASNVIMMTTDKIGGLYAGRLLIGIANGLLMTFSQLYIQECSPAQYRGLMIGSFQSWTSIGSLVGTIIDNFTVKIGGKQSYILPLGIVYVIPGLISLGLLLIPESPRWLLQHDREEPARKALKWLRPHPELVDAELADIKSVIDAEKNLAQNTEIVDIWKNPVDRRRTLLAVGAVSLQAASGAMYMISYGTYFFEMANIGSAFENSCILTGVGVLVILINSAIITRWGRRRVFLLWGLIICGLCQMVVAAVYTANPGTTQTGKLIVSFSILYIIGYNGMVATYAWLCGGEFPSQRLRSYTFGLASSIGFLGAWLATFTAPYFINPKALGWGPKYGYIWMPSCFIGAAWVWFFLPEVKNRTFEEIDEMFEARLPARKFRHYVCVGPAALAAMGEKHKHEEAHEPVTTHEEVIWGEKGGKAATEMATAIA
ncbi:MFS transporter [Halenospora varia]|nr:MFS transporter [Halenospora varia]